MSYFSKITTTIFLVGLITFLSIIFISESIYRDPLFKKSLTLQKEWQQRQTDSFLTFLSVVTKFSTEIVYFSLIFLVFLFVPLNKSYALTASLVYAGYFSNFLKVIYASPRPFFIDPDLFKECQGNFGNPSTQVFTATSFYLSFWHVVTDFSFFTKTYIGKILRFVLFIFTANFIILIILSRLFLGAHAANQVLFGNMLGIAVYYTIFHVVALQNFTAEEFLKLFRKNFYIIMFSIWYGLLILAAIFLCLFKTNDTTNYEKVLTEYCPDMLEIKKFNNDALISMMQVFSIIGAHYGLIFLISISDKKYFDKNEEINFWYRSADILSHIYRILIVFVFMLPIIFNFTISLNEAIVVVYLFKIILPFFLTYFGMFGLSVHYSFEFKVGNKDLHNQYLDEMGFAVLEIAQDS